MSQLDYYVTLLEDSRRIAATGRAIAAVVRPGDHVVEVGCGLGTYSLFAARAGARLVTAIDRDPLAIALAREIGVERLGEGRIRLVHAPIEQVTLSEPADLVIFEDFGGFGHQSELRTLFEHVRARLVRPGARFIPEAVELHLAPIEYPVRSLDAAAPGPLPFPPEAVALLRKRSLQDPNGRKVLARHLVGQGVPVGEIRLAEPFPTRSTYAGRGQAQRAGAVNALAGWMKLSLGGGEFLTNTPFEERLSWEILVFPFEEPLTVEAGASLDLRMEAVYGPGPSTLLWRWSVRGPGGCRESCSVNAVPGDPESLRAGSPEAVPRPLPLSRAIAAVCAAVDGRASVAEIARAVYDRGDHAVADPRSAESLVLEVLKRLRGVMAE